MFSLKCMNVGADMIPKRWDKATETNCTSETVMIKEEVRQSRSQLRRLTWAAWKFDFINCYELWYKRVFRLEPLLIGEHCQISDCTSNLRIPFYLYHTHIQGCSQCQCCSILCWKLNRAPLRWTGRYMALEGTVHPQYNSVLNSTKQLK